MERVLEVSGLTRTFYNGKTLQTAVNQVSFWLDQGETLGIVGESGCGKTTTVKMITRLLEAEAGIVKLCGRDITHARGRELRTAYDQLQMVFQTPVESFNPRMTLGAAVAETMRNRKMSKTAAWRRTGELFGQCGLPTALMKRYPHQVSGGQCQRAAIARAIAVRPKLLICDEVTSALDVMVQQQIIRLLREHQQKSGMSLLFISHDLALVQKICSRVIVMKDGRIVETGETDKVIQFPEQEYTKQLVATAGYM